MSTVSKIYKDPGQRGFKNNFIYTEGKNFKTPSHRKSVKAKNKFAKKLTFELWVKREYFLLSKLYLAGCSIPKPIGHSQNSVLMQFIGNRKTSAPRLIDIKLSPEEYNSIKEGVLRNIKLFLECGVVHGDLSFYNILYWDRRIWIIDFPQAIDIRNNPRWLELLKRDIDNSLLFISEYERTDLLKELI